MRNDEFWFAVEMPTDRSGRRGRIGPVRVALLFGTLAVALALLVPPMLDTGHRNFAGYGGGPGIDTMTTASIPQRNGSRVYTERRSILQEPGSVCIVQAAGRGFGDC